MSVDLEAGTGVPLVGWQASRDEWLAARRRGLGASDVYAVLGFSRWHTPWQVWAEKKDVRRPDDIPSAAADLGNDLEPWLLSQAARLLGRPVGRTPARLYAHPEHRWRMASPDGISGADLIEAKTAGLASGYGVPEGWTDTQIPLGYELQVRWQMHVCGAPRVHVVALLAGLGVCHYIIDRDLGVENDLVGQVDAWWRRHMLDGVEPPLQGADAEVLKALYPAPTGGQVDLDDTDATELLMRYAEAHRTEQAAKHHKNDAAARLKGLLGAHTAGRVAGRVVCTWDTQHGRVDWYAMATALAEELGVELPDPETYRRPPTRVLNVKDVI